MSLIALRENVLSINTLETLIEFLKGSQKESDVKAKVLKPNVNDHLQRITYTLDIFDKEIEGLSNHKVTPFV